MRCPKGANWTRSAWSSAPLLGLISACINRPPSGGASRGGWLLQKIASLNKYAQMLKQHPEEAQALADDIFIHVTSFFRDPECFQALRKRVLAKLSRKRPAGDPLRIWVAGCSTGEEVYSIAMLLLEELGERANRTKIQIFGTDIQERAVEQCASRHLHRGGCRRGVSGASETLLRQG